MEHYREQEACGVTTESFFKPSEMPLEVEWSKRDAIKFILSYASIFFLSLIISFALIQDLLYILRDVYPEYPSSF